MFSDLVDRIARAAEDTGGIRTNALSHPRVLTVCFSALVALLLPFALTGNPLWLLIEVVPVAGVFLWAISNSE